MLFISHSILVNCDFILFKNSCLVSFEISPYIKSFKIIREYETKEETKKYTHDEAINNAKESIKTEILKKTSSNSQILDQKVLKESEFDSKIELEVFVSVLENISKREYFEESDINDTN